jgi:iron(III) transport system permease protein
VNWLLLQNSLLVAGTTTAVAVGFGLLAALWLAGLEKVWRNVFLALTIVALALPPFLVTNCWLDLLGEMGVWRSWLPLNIFSLNGSVLILSLLLWPITTLLVLNGWRRLEVEQLECDPALSGFSLLRVLLLPMARGELLLAALLTFVLALNNFAVPAILQTKVLPDDVWIRFNTQFDALGALTSGLPLIIAPVVFLLLFWRRVVAWPRTQGAVPAKIFRRQLCGAWFGLSGTLTIVLCAVSVGVPLGQIAFAGRTWAELPGAVEAGTGAIWNSIWFAAVAATVAVSVALVLRSRRREAAEVSGSGWVRLLTSAATIGCWLPFFIPGVLIGIALIKVFNRPVLVAFYQSAGIVLLAYVLRYFALGLTAVRHALGSVDSDLADVGRLEGATRWQMFRLVLWPQIAPQVLAGWHVVYLLCLWDVESIVLVQPPGGETLALKIFNLLHYGHAAQVNALCLVLLGVAIAPLLAVAAVVRARQFLSTRKPGEVGRALTSAATIAMVAVLPGCSPAPRTNEAPLKNRFFERAIVVGLRGVGIGEFNKPRSVTCDAVGNVYAVDMTGRVQKFSPDGKFLLSWQMPETTLGKPKGMGRDRDGNILVVEPHYQRVNHFTPDGKLLAQWGCKGTNEGCFMLPRGIAVNSHGEFLVSEYMGAERIQRFALPDGSLKPGGQSQSNVRPHPGPLPPERGNDAPPTATSGSSRESAVAGKSKPLTPALSPSEGARENTNWPYAKADAPLGTQSQQHAGSETGAPGREATLLQVIGRAGTGPGEFNRAEGVCVDAQDRLYVADSCNHRVEIFSADGKFLREYGKPGSGLGELSYPYDIAVDAQGNQFVCEFGNSRLQVFDANCQPVEIIGGAGAAPGQFSNPWSIALDSHGNLYVADALNHRLQKLVRRSNVAAEVTRGIAGTDSEVRLLTSAATN